MEEDSKAEKAGREIGNCVKDLRMKKLVPPPEEEMSSE